MSIAPVILCGGAGRRLWPLSRPDRPKPLLSLGGQTLLSATARRFAGPGFLAPWLVAGRDHALAMAQAVPDAARVLVEPVARGTAMAVAVSAVLAHREDPSALLLVTPADHVVAEPMALLQAIEQARAAARQGLIVTFGIAPDRAATEYGWIAAGQPLDMGEGVRGIARFVEKPERALAERLLSEGGHLWNAGLFLFQADAVLLALQEHAPSVLKAACSAVERAVFQGRQVLLDEEALREVPSQSFDVAVMERTSQAAVLPVSCGWSDVGSWGALRALQPEAVGPVTLQDAPGTLAYSDGPQLAVLGAPDLVVVATAGAVLVAGPGHADRCGKFPPPTEVVLDRGARHEVRRTYIPQGERFSVPEGGFGLLLEGSVRSEQGAPAQGRRLEPGLYRAERGSTVLIVTWADLL